MAKTGRGPERREEGLSRERIVDAAIELLDAEGESGLTFRALATRLATGSGALYWHVANKGDLLTEAADAIVARAMEAVVAHAAPREAIRGVAAGVFEAIDAHPWVAAQLARAPGQGATLRIFERIGQQVQALGVPDGAQFTVVSALLGYILGVSEQNAANGRERDPSVDRAKFLAAMAARWQALDPGEYPFARRVAAQLREHDDRAEFLAGLDLILAGIAAHHRPAGGSREGQATRAARGQKRK